MTSSVMSPEVKQSQFLRYDPFGGRVSILLFGRPLDWNISGDQTQDVRERIAEAAARLGVEKIYAPRPATFNAEVCTPADLGETIDLGSGVTMYRGFDADGSEIPPGEAFWLSSADCLSVVVSDCSTGRTFAAHAGRDCLIDRGRINNTGARRYESVVDAIVDRYENGARRRLQVFMTCGVGPEHFSHPLEHPEYGKNNRKMVNSTLRKWGFTTVYGDDEEGRLCLSEIVRAQFIAQGIRPHFIGHDIVDTYSDRGQDGDYRWWSYRRGDGKNRNGVLIKRNY